MMKDNDLLMIVLAFFLGFAVGAFAGKKDGKREATREMNIELIERGLKYYHPESGEIIWK